MADQWMQMLEAMPPGADVFDYIKDLLTSQMFPHFGKGYWGVIYFLVVLQSLSLLGIVLAFYLKIRNKGFAWIIVQDGACTHISPKAWLPFWWAVMAALLLGQIAWTRITFTSHRYTGAFTAYSVVVGAIPFISFACLTLHVWTNAPPFRRFLIRLNTSRDKATRGLDRSVIFINTSLFLFCGFAGGLLALPGGQAYHQGDTAGRVYAEAIKILDDAKVTQDVAALMNLTPIMAKFASTEASRHHANNLSGYVFSPFFLFYLFGAIFPAILLNIYIRNRIKDYDLGLSTSQPSFQLAQSLPHLGNNDITATGSHIDEEQTGQLTNAARPIPIHLPQPQKPQKLPSYLPKDRPFANIVEVRHTTVAPQHLQRIMDTKGFKPADKSARLKAALRRDNQVLIAYCVLLLAMGSLAFYQLSGYAGKSLHIAMLWEYLAFTIPSSFMSAMFLYDAIRNDTTEEAIEAVVPPTFSRQKTLASVPNLITLSQNVSVVEEYAMDDKAERSEKEKILKPYRYR